MSYGASAKGVSFADYITVHNGMTMTKEAVSGTTMVDDAPDSYVSRMKRLDKSITADLLVCQLSTNDASQKKPLGTVSTSRDMSDFNTHTIAGAIEYIIVYAQDTWHCPVVFYTNTRYSSEAYSDMVALLHTIAEKWNVLIIDLWSNDEMNAITDAQRTLWMADNIHPTQAGYQEWWMPVMEAALADVLSRE